MAQGLGNTMKAIEGTIGKATERLLMSDLSNLTATAKQQLIDDVKRAVLDSNQFRADLAKIIADDFAARINASWKEKLKSAFCFIGWVVTFLVALIGAIDPLKVMVGNWLLKLAS